MLCLTYEVIIIALLSLVFLLIALKIFVKATLGRCRSMVCLTGKTVIVTGGCSGIGFETALKLASRGARVILADKQDGATAKQRIIDETHNENIVVKHIDLSSFKSIRKFAKEINETEKRLDILINNAGIGAFNELRTEDGLNPIMQVNHFGSFLLTHLLIDLLKKTAPSRIIFVSSGLAFFSNLTLAKLNLSHEDCIPSAINSLKQYSHSKLCNIIAANGFADKLKGTGITSNSLHPGMVSTNIYSTSCNIIGMSVPLILSAILRSYGKTSEEGAQTAIHLALSNDANNVTGKHFWDCKAFPIPPKLWNQSFVDSIWRRSEEIVSLKPEELLKNK